MIKQFANKSTVAAIAAVFLLACGPAPAQQSKYQEGVHYFKIDQATPPATDGKVEVTEVFSYMCPHCNTFEPFIANWLEHKPDNVNFVRLPVIFGRKPWELYARAYVTADMMGVAEAGHGPLMDALYKEKKIMRDMEELGEFYSKFGVSATEFVATSDSFAVDARLRKEQRLSQAYGVSGTPSVVINGKYLVRGSQAVPNYDTLLDIVNTLIAQEVAAMPKAAAETSPEPAGEAATEGR